MVKIIVKFGGKMNYDIRKICVYFNEVHSRYYIDTNGVVYTSVSLNTNKIRCKGRVYNINSFRKTNLSKLNNTNKMIISIPFLEEYFMLNDGTVLQRLHTKIDEHKNIYIRLVCIDDDIKIYKISNLISGVFHGIFH